MKKIVLILIIGIMTFALAACGSQTTDSADTVKYKGQKYVYLEYPANVFYYDYNGSSHDNFEEVDGIYPIDSPQWDMIWNSGDLYCDKHSADAAAAYYADDENYTWYYLIESDEEDNEINALPVTVTASELEVVYDVENQEKGFALFFEEFDALGSLFKISKDGIVRGTLSIGKYEDTWYWRSEIIDDSLERDGTWPEYVQPLPETLSSKIIEAE